MALSIDHPQDDHNRNLCALEKLCRKEQEIEQKIYEIRGRFLLFPHNEIDAIKRLDHELTLLRQSSGSSVKQFYMVDTAAMIKMLCSRYRAPKTYFHQSMNHSLGEIDCRLKQFSYLPLKQDANSFYRALASALLIFEDCSARKLVIEGIKRITEGAFSIENSTLFDRFKVVKPTVLALLEKYDRPRSNRDQRRIVEELRVNSILDEAMMFTFRALTAQALLEASQIQDDSIFDDHKQPPADACNTLCQFLGITVTVTKHLHLKKERFGSLRSCHAAWLFCHTSGHYDLITGPAK